MIHPAPVRLKLYVGRQDGSVGSREGANLLKHCPRGANTISALLSRRHHHADLFPYCFSFLFDF